MKILAFDTSAESCSVALYSAGTCLEKMNIEPRKQAERLLPIIDSLLIEAGLRRSDLSGLALTHGPGAFTGVRIAISAGQAIAYALDLPVVTVSTLAAIAQGAHRKWGWQHVAVAVDARMDEVYWGCYQLSESGLMEAVMPDAIARPETVQLPVETPWRGAGSAWLVYREKIPNLAETHGLTIEAIDIISLALPQFNQGNTIRAHDVKPVYLRNKVV
ncbi:MAG: tRNA (adenosine(37)-N6)-threonylcarbamoyltransferase complex dimerization subunit type 1 TsaB [Gammaproteobacteria bacterium]|nr:tRNA (adenosine(37)-N6)-threonylcarbamoyltransferase complex dimerization subunit type 1 TsaB [Gammaproteobacteria bacterium]